MYSLAHYQRMFADPLRGGRMSAALRSLVRPDDIVLEVGAGPGHLAVIAAIAGARHVYAVETSEFVGLGAELAALHGVSDRITWKHADVRDIELPERATVLVADLRVSHAYFGDGIAVLNDVRRRLCVPGVRELTRRDVHFVAPCELPPDRPWLAEVSPHGVDSTPVLRRIARSERGLSEFKSEWLLGEATQWGELPYAIDAPVDADAKVSWQASRDGTLNALVIWFDAEFADGQWLTHGPDQPMLPWGRQRLPIVDPIPVVRGDRIDAAFAFTLIDGEYVRRWAVTVTPPEGSGRVPSRRAHSTLDQLVLTPESLQGRSIRSRPDLGPGQPMVVRALGLSDGTRTLAEIGEALLREFPASFASAREATLFATRIASALPSTPGE